MKNSFKEVTFSRIFRVEKFQQLQNERKNARKLSETVDKLFQFPPSALTWRTNFWSITFFPILAWKSDDSRKRKNTS